MKQLKRFVEEPRSCSYLPSEQAALEYRVLTEVSPGELGELLERGWRHFGPVYFRPACAACQECVSLRIPVEGFTPTPSQKRALRRVRRLSRVIGPPQVDEERLALLRVWHEDREASRGWEGSTVSEDDYRLQFAHRGPSSRELSLYDNGRLVGVSLFDLTERALSAIYFYYHPELARLSLGTGNVLLLIELARQLEVPYVYLGYRVRGCASLRYKAAFGPHELLSQRPEPEEKPPWRRGP